MAIWVPPPPPFMGGFQPHSPRELAPILEDAKLPYLRRPEVTLRLIAQAWQPPDPQPFLGGRQPLDNRRWRSYPTDAPPLRPFVQTLAGLVSSWPRDAWDAQRSPKTQWPPDAPLPRSIAAAMARVLAWPAEAWPAQHGAWIVALIPPDRAPTIEVFAENFASIVAMWPRDNWNAQRSPRTLWPPDVPPLSHGPKLARLIATWPRDDWGPQRAPQTFWPTDQPPLISGSLEELAALLAAWQPEWRMPPTAPAFASLLPVPVPFSLSVFLEVLLPTWQDVGMARPFFGKPLTPQDGTIIDTFRYGLTAGPGLSDKGGVSAGLAQGLGKDDLQGIPQSDPP